MDKSDQKRPLTDLSASISGGRLDLAYVEALAHRVVELLHDETRESVDRRLVDAATLAAELGVERSWVYEHANELQPIRLGNGPKARLRFRLAHRTRNIRRAEPHRVRLTPERRRDQWRSISSSGSRRPPSKADSRPCSRSTTTRHLVNRSHRSPTTSLSVARPTCPAACRSQRQGRSRSYPALAGVASLYASARHGGRSRPGTHT